MWRRFTPRDWCHPLFEGLRSPLANLLLASPLLVPLVRDWPAATSVLGFSWFAPAHLGDAAWAEALGQRAILVAARRFHDAFPPRPHLLVTGYLPYQLLFQRLAVSRLGGNDAAREQWEAMG